MAINELYLGVSSGLISTWIHTHNLGYYFVKPKGNLRHMRYSFERLRGYTLDYLFPRGYHIPKRIFWKSIIPFLSNRSKQSFCCRYDYKELAKGKA